MHAAPSALRKLGNLRHTCTMHNFAIKIRDPRPTKPLAHLLEETPSLDESSGTEPTPSKQPSTRQDHHGGSNRQALKTLGTKAYHHMLQSWNRIYLATHGMQVKPGIKKVINLGNPMPHLQYANPFISAAYDCGRIAIHRKRHLDFRDSPSGLLLNQLKSERADYAKIFFSNCAHYIALLNADRFGFKIRDTQSGAWLWRTIAPRSKYVTSFAFYHGAEAIRWTYSNGECWHAAWRQSTKEKLIHRFDPELGMPNFSHDGKHVLIFTRNPTQIQILHAASGQYVRSLTGQYIYNCAATNADIVVATEMALGSSTFANLGVDAGEHTYSLPRSSFRHISLGNPNLTQEILLGTDFSRRHRIVAFNMTTKRITEVFNYRQNPPPTCCFVLSKFSFYISFESGKAFIIHTKKPLTPVCQCD